jgi:mRNA-degrading endonuclease YafQ of YafQ-DinJ toxin-antitoxin module
MNSSKPLDQRARDHELTKSANDFRRSISRLHKQVANYHDDDLIAAMRELKSSSDKFDQALRDKGLGS